MQHYSDGARHRPNPAPMPGEGWRVTLQKQVVVNSMEKRIYEHVYYDPCMKYWVRKGRITTDADSMVDWKAYDGALTLMPYGKRQWVRKHFCGFEGTNQMLFRQGRRVNEYCPKCKEVETYRHIAQCQSNDATNAFRGIQREFDQWLQSTTSPGIKDAVLEHIRAYRERDVVEEGENWSERLRMVSREQEEIGQNAFMEGCITRKWKEIQDTHLKAIRSRKSPSRWARELIKKLWLVSWDMWDTRNGWIHQQAEVKTQQISKQLDAEIDRLHAIGTENKRFYTQVDRIFFREQADKIKEQSDYQKGTWINAAKKIIERDKQTVAREEEIRTIREFLRPGSTAQVESRRDRIINQWDNNFRRPEGTRRGPGCQED